MPHKFKTNMKATKVNYEKTFNLGNYQNEVIGIEIEIEENETAQQAFEMAKRFVEYMHYDKRKEELENAREIVRNPDCNSYTRVMEAKATIDRLEGMGTDDDLPF